MNIIQLLILLIFTLGTYNIAIKHMDLSHHTYFNRELGIFVHNDKHNLEFGKIKTNDHEDKINLHKF